MRSRQAGTRPSVTHVAVTVLLLAGGLAAGAQTPQGIRRPVEAAATTVTPPAAPTHEATVLVAAAQGLLLRAAFSGLPLQGSVTAGIRPAAVGAMPRLAPFVRPSALPPSSPVGATTRTLGVLWAAYDMAARRVPARCHLPTTLLAAIGHVESGSLAGRRLDPEHVVVPPVLGPVLSGGRVAAIRDSDDGRWDGDRVWDRAVGPMQFIPGTWRFWGSDGNGDGVADPQNIEDAAYSAARYLCAGGRDLSRPADLRAAILAYNRSSSYVATVLALMQTISPGSMPRLPSAPPVPARPPRTPSPAATTPAPGTPTTTTPPPTSPRPTTTTPPATTAPTTTPPASSMSSTPAPTASSTSSAPASTSSAPASTSSAPATTTSSTTSTPGTTSAESGTPVPPTTP